MRSHLDPVLDIRQLSATEARLSLPALAAILLDCVEGGASVSFMASFSLVEAESFFENVIADIEQGKRILLAAYLEDVLVGTVQIVTATPPNQPHRAEVAKLLVHRSARGQGVATKLMREVETAARQAGKTLLVLDTVTGGTAEKLYTNLGWTKVGVIPDYALFPDGAWCDTTIFFKQLT